jgi:hypothetical protein
MALLCLDDKDKSTPLAASLAADEKEKFIDEARKIQVLLSFSAELLRNSYNKDVYNSTEVRKMIHRTILMRTAVCCNFRLAYLFLLSNYFHAVAYHCFVEIL